MEESEDLDLSWLFVNVPFFWIWNGCIGSQVAVAFSYLIRGKCHESTAILVCPHWIVGIVLPATMGYAWMDLTGMFILLFLTVFLPYSILFYVVHKGNDELRAIPLCSCLCPRDATTSSLPESETPNDEAAHTRREKEACLIFKKVVLLENDNKAKVDNIDHQSFRSAHPKTDIYVRGSQFDLEEKITSGFTGDQSSLTASTQMCAICLEEYQVGQEIAYAKNPECHHVYHKNCLLQLLENHDDCPICRKSYSDFTDLELG